MLLTTVILDNLNNIAGCYIALSKAEDLQLSPINHWREPPEITLLNDAIEALYQEVAKEDYLLQFFAVRFDLRGFICPEYNQKIADILFQSVIDEARKNTSPALAMMTWVLHKAAMKFYQRYGAEVVQRMDLHHTIFNDDLLLLKIPLFLT